MAAFPGRFRSVALLLLASAAAAGPPRVAFLSRRDDDARSALYVMDAGGGGARRLAGPARDLMHFSCAPDGRIAYVFDHTDSEDFRLRVLHPDTGKDTTVGTGIRWFAQWSRDGTRLAYMHHGGGWRIRLTSPAVVIERPPQQRVGGDGAPSWSPDGKSVAFQSNRDGNLELYVADARTGKPRRLTRTTEAETHPSWSPDGKWLAYRRGGDLWRIRPDGSGAERLTKGEGQEAGAEWSPDGTRLAFVAKRGDTSDLVVLEPGTGKRTQLTRRSGRDFAPAWSPDGRRLLFVSDRDGNEEIYVMNADGTDVRRLTQNPARDYAPAWLAPAAR